ncbi:MAG: septum formation protein Maf [Rhodospirillales bacterium]|nr:septum formation protein Maf [Rhodospirillales bacterium]
MSGATLVLASASSARQAMLAGAGLDFTIDPAHCDEGAIKESRKGQPALAIAQALAEAKALAVGRRHPESWVIGADQILECDGTLYDKPRDLAAARRQLQDLRGRTHELVSAVALARQGRIDWTACDRARLTLRDFPDAELDAYLERVGVTALASVGAYRIEGPAIRLFERIEGDHFTILGLPLLALLAALRQRGALS